MHRNNSETNFNVLYMECTDKPGFLVKGFRSQRKLTGSRELRAANLGEAASRRAQEPLGLQTAGSSPFVGLRPACGKVWELLCLASSSSQGSDGTLSISWLGGQ